MKPLRTVVLGANGQLGTDLAAVFAAGGAEVIPANHNLLDITRPDEVTDFLTAAKPYVVLNATACHNLDLCEANPELAMEVNAHAVQHLALLASDINFRLVHISTDYVFNGEKAYPYVETDKPAPLNVYGQTKYAGEQLLAAETENYVIARTSALYGHAPCRAKNGLNFIRLMLKLATERPALQVVNDEFVSPTSTRDLARQLLTLVQHDATGLFHLTSGSFCSWYEFAWEILRLCNVPVPVEPVPSDNYNKVPRPKFSVLENAHAKQLGLNEMPHWRESLERYLRELN